MPLIKTTINTNVNAGGMSFVPVQQEVLSDGGAALARDLPGNATDIEFTFAVPVLASVKAFFLSCKKKAGETAEAGTLVIKTNSSTAPDDTWTIRPVRGLAWDSDDPTALPITSPITKIFVSNTGSSILEFTAFAALDATPGVSG